MNTESPTPWQIMLSMPFGGKKQDQTAWVIGCVNDHPPGELCVGYIAREGDAKKIVKTMNCHDELVKTIECFLNGLAEKTQKEYPGFMQRARSILEKVES